MFRGVATIDVRLRFLPLYARTALKGFRRSRRVLIPSTGGVMAANHRGAVLLCTGFLPTALLTRAKVEAPRLEIRGAAGVRARPFPANRLSHTRRSSGHTAQWRIEPYERGPAGQRYMVVIDGANHQDFRGDRPGSRAPTLWLWRRRRSSTGVSKSMPQREYLRRPSGFAAICRDRRCDQVQVTSTPLGGRS